VQRRTAPKTMAWWLFYFVSRCGFTVLWVVLFLQARNGCPSVFLSFSALSLCLCVREESFWVGWTQAFSGSLLWFCPCFCSGFLSSCFCFLPRFCSFLPLVFGSNSPLFCLSVSPCSSPQFSPCSSPPPFVFGAQNRPLFRVFFFSSAPPLCSCFQCSFPCFLLGSSSFGLFGSLSSPVVPLFYEFFLWVLLQFSPCSSPCLCSALPFIEPEHAEKKTRPPVHQSMSWIMGKKSWCRGPRFAANFLLNRLHPLKRGRR